MQSLAEIEPLKSMTGFLNVPPERIESVEAKLLHLPQVECPLVHRFAPGVYMREILMPRGSFIIGHQHNTEHLNIVMSGKAAVMMDGVMHMIDATTCPQTFVSNAGVRKVLYIMETMRWATIHPSELTDLKELEAALITKSESFKAVEDMKKLKALVEQGEVQ